MSLLSMYLLAETLTLWEANGEFPQETGLLGGILKEPQRGFQDP